MSDKERPLTWNKMNEFERAFWSLPDAADHDTEMDWVACHSALTRRNRQKDPEAFIYKINYEDLMTIHGQAPSKRAANMLAHYGNCPEKFFDMMAKAAIDKAKKKPPNEGNSVKELDPELAEVEKLLMEMRK